MFSLIRKIKVDHLGTVGQIDGCEFSKDNYYIIASDNHGAAKVYIRSSGKYVNEVKHIQINNLKFERAGKVNAVGYSYDRKYFYTGINDHIVVRQGQSIYGGATVAVKLADGSTEYIKTPSATLSGTGGNGSMGGPRRILQMADNSRLEGATLNLTNTASSTGVYINEVDNAKVINNTINVESTTATASGIQLSSGAFADRPMNTEIRNNQISTTASSAGSYSRSIVLIHNENTIISGNQITSEALSGSTREDLIFINGDTVNISGSGNSGNISSCRHASGTITGSVGFTTATDNDCP